MRLRNLLLVVVPAVLLVVILAIPPLRWAVWGLLHREPFADGAPISYWINEYDDGDDGRRERAVRSLDRIEVPHGDKASLLGTASREDRNVEIRRLAVESLGRMAPTGYPVRGSLAEASKDKDHRVRLAAARALALDPSPDYRVREALARLAEDENPEVRRAAADSLQSVGKP